jgi:hypothetical protein
MDEELDYKSSSPLLATAPDNTKPQDEIDLPTLKRVQQMLEDQIASYSTIERLTLDSKDLTVEQQLAVNKSIAFHLNEIKLLVETVVANIKEKYEQ